MKNNDLEILEKNRNALLLAEIGCWIHMLGKFHEKFLQGERNYDIEIVKKLENEPKYSNLVKLLKGVSRPTWMSKAWQTLPTLKVNPETSIATFIEKHRKRKDNLDNLEKLLSDAHGQGSRIEKGILNRFFPSQDKNIYLSTAFGFEKDYININKIKLQRENLYSFLEECLNTLRNNQANVKNWHRYRTTFIDTITEFFRTTLADSRRPINDVSVFDQTAISVALFKAVLAQVVLTECNNSTESKYYWRFLRIGINGPSFWSKSPKIGDIFARKHILSKALDKIRDFIEFQYPLGFEIYRDENGSVFVVPNIQNMLDYTVKNYTVRQMLEKIFLETTEEEGAIILDLSENTRDMLIFGEITHEKISEGNIYSENIRKLWQNTYNQEVCSACGLRPQGKKHIYAARNICDICKERRLHPSEEWCRNLKNTIWMDEISDVNGRVALITGRFAMKEWLSGDLLNSIVAFDPKKRKLIDKIRNKEYIFDYQQLTKEISEAIENKQTLGRHFELLNNLMLKDHRNELDKFIDMFDFYIKESDLDVPEREAWRFALFMMRQYPSFARIQRIWETTRQFWQDILPTTEDILPKKDIPSETKDILGIMGPRLLITGSIPSRKTPDPYHAYELLINGTKLSVVWDESRNGFIVIENAAYITQVLGHKIPERKKETIQEYQKKVNTWALSKIKEHMKGELHIEEPVGYGAPDKEWGTIIVTDVKEIPDSEYIPAIPILAEPSTFIALVPADKALNVVKLIREKYNTEMGKVKNRLPLHMGIIFTHRHTPLRIIMDAGQRMLQLHVNPEPWKVTTIQSGIPHTSPHFRKMVQVHLETNANTNKNAHTKTLQWNIPLKMGDGTTDDNWYPYVFLKSWTGTPPEERTRSLKTVAPWNTHSTQFVWLIHVSDLERGDTIYFTPSTLDFEWLDTSSRRFEIAYKKGTHTRVNSISRPYLLDTVEHLEEIWNTLKTSLKNSQIYTIRELIERKKKEWNCKDKTFEQFCRNTIAVSEWVPDAEGYPWEKEKISKREWLNKWTHYAVTGLLCDAIELHMQIMKEKSQAGGD